MELRRRCCCFSLVTHFVVQLYDAEIFEKISSDRVSMREETEMEFYFNFSGEEN